MAKQISPDVMRLAADWLESYDEEASESSDIFAVARWLREKADAKDESAVIREFAKSQGTSVGTVRSALARVRRKKNAEQI